MAVAGGLLTRGLLDQAVPPVRDALQVLAGTPRPLVHADALEDLAVMVAADRPREAVAALDEALGLVEAAGAEVDAARLRSRLRELGVNRRRTPLRAPPEHGLQALTRAELEVVELVAAGGTNRRVAEQLFLSPHTVNTHLRNAFLKLGVRSRVELARLVTAHGLG
jgi:DNA-binding CsgD family transcriptional regulator